MERGRARLGPRRPVDRYNQLVTLLTLGFLLAASSAPSSLPAPAAVETNGLSVAQGKAFLEKMDSLAKTVAGRREALQVSEGELNSYVNLLLGRRMPRGVSDVVFKFDKDRLALQAVVDMEEAKAYLGKQSPWSPLALLSGEVTIESSGRFAGDDGFGRIEVEEVRLGGVTLPTSVLSRLIAGATRSADQPDGFDLASPFRLPSPIKRLRLVPGRALLDF